MLQVLEGSNGTITRMAIQHAVVTTKFIFEPWPAAVVDVLGYRLQRLNDDRIKGARSGRVALSHSSTMPYPQDNRSQQEERTSGLDFDWP
jgi:hypothetical protein